MVPANICGSKFVEWQVDEITGRLRSEPRGIADLEMGQRVVVDLAEVRDYVWRFPDGRWEGDETGKVLRRLRDAE